MAIRVGDPSLQSGERGSVLPIVLVTTFSIGALSMAHLTKVMAEGKKVREEMYSARAMAAAEGELEFAKNVVNASPYVNGRNSVLMAATAASPPVVPGTSVRVQPLGDGTTDWYLLRATGSCVDVTKTCQVFCRQSMPVSVYNYFVIDHKLGLMGSPRGKVHSNKSIDFFFPGGLYRDPVTASEGFAFVYGAAQNNTTFLSTWDAHARSWDILADVDVQQANKPDNTLSVTTPQIAEVTLQRQNATVKLYEPGHYISVPVQVPTWIFDHYDTIQWPQWTPVYRTVQVTITVPVYESQQQDYTVQVPIYQLQQVPVTVYSQVWVVDPPPPLDQIGSGDLGAGAVGGHWETVSSVQQQWQQVVIGYNTETRTRTIQVQTGTQDVVQNQQVLDHWDIVWVPWTYPVYRIQMVDSFQQQWVPEQLVSTQVVPASGVYYFEGPVRKLDGQLEGRLSIVSNDNVAVTGSLQYVDGNGNTRMKNGLDPAQTYDPNPAYHGNAVLGVMANGDIRYANTVPDDIEINASLVSKNGTVAYQGITVTDNGETVGYTGPNGAPTRLKDSMRRLGGIVSRQRPVATYVTNTGSVFAGFQKGASQMDRNLMVGGGGGLPYMFTENKPLWTMQKTGRVFEPQ